MDSAKQSLSEPDDSPVTQQESKTARVDNAVVLHRGETGFSLPSYFRELVASVRVTILVWCRHQWLDVGIQLHRATVEIRRLRFQNRPGPMNTLARLLFIRYKQRGDTGDLNEAIKIARGSLAFCPQGDSERQILSNGLTVLLFARYQRFGEADDLNDAIRFAQDSVALCPPGDSNRLIYLSMLASTRSIRYKKLGRFDDLDAAVDLSRESLALCPSENSNRAKCLNDLAGYLSDKYEMFEEIGYLDEAIGHARGALGLRPPGHSDRPTSLRSLATCLSARYGRLRGIGDLNEAIDLFRENLALCPAGNSRRATCVNDLGAHLYARYKQLGGVDDFNEAIELAQESLVLLPSGHQDRSAFLNNLAYLLSIRYQQRGGIEDLNKAIDLARDSLMLCPPEHSSRSTPLSSLAQFLFTRYQQRGGIDELNEVIDLSRESLAYCPPERSDCSTSSSTLSASLHARYQLLGRIDDLDEAIDLAQKSLACPLGDPDRSTSLSNLSHFLSTRYDQYGRIDDLNEAIGLARESLALRPPGHSDRSMSLNNLAAYLVDRYHQLGGIDDINEAIGHARDSLVLRPPGHSDRSMSLSNLAQFLFTRYQQCGGIDELNEVIGLAQESLILRPLGHSDRAVSLNNLALFLIVRHQHGGGIDDLDEAIVLARDALELCPPGHPSRAIPLSSLAVYLSTRYQQRGGADDLDKAIDLSRDSLSLCPPGHPRRSTILGHLTGLLHLRSNQLGGVEAREELLSLYAQLEHVSQTVSTSDLSVAKSWVITAEIFHHPTTLLAYRTALRLLVQHVAALPSLPQHLDTLKTLSSTLAVDAFSACLRDQRLTEAVELLEQGRGVFWSQLNRLRSPLDDVVASGTAGKALADEFTRLTSVIRRVLDSPGEDQHDRVCRLNLDLQKVVSNIRHLPGLSRFFLPALFSDLQSAASDGPVIIVNASKYSCDALVVFVDRDPVHIPLPVTDQGVQGLALKLRALIRRAKSVDMTRDFGLFLRELWDQVVSHIVGILQTACPLQSRIWWCPTGEFCLLPLHAAAPLRKGQKGVSDLYISSYAPTLAALIRARRPRSPDVATEKRRFIAIGQATAKGASELFFVSTELANICQLFGGLATFTSIEGENACISRVADELGRSEWAHFACHGVLNREQPFDSAFALHDGLFTIQRITHCNLENPEFAYLSACHTTAGDEESPDEVIHLASAMQFAGFRSVIGTMWGVDDAETTKVTTTFYKHMVDESGHLDHTRAALALWKTMRSVKLPMDQRILYVHLGA